MGLPGLDSPTGFQISWVILAQNLNLSGPLGKSKGSFSVVWEGHREGSCYSPPACLLPTPSQPRTHWRLILFRRICDHRSARREKKGLGRKRWAFRWGARGPGPARIPASPLRWPPSLPQRWELSYLSLERVWLMVLCRGGWPGRGSGALGKPGWSMEGRQKER